MSENIVQNRIVASRGSSITVTASAGCGKTTTMIARIADLVTKSGISVNDLLVLTFTNASAADMQAKLYRKLKTLSAGDDFVRKQLSSLDYADICTIDSFCTKLLRTYFTKLGIDPAFRIQEPAAADMTVHMLLDEILAECYESPSPVFLSLSDVLRANRSDDALKQVILNLYEFSLNLVDPDSFLSEGIYASLERDPAKNPSCLFYEKRFRAYLEDRGKSDEFLLSALRETGQEKNAASLANFYIHAKALLEANSSATFWEYAADFPDFDKSVSPGSKADDKKIGVYQLFTEKKELLKPVRNEIALVAKTVAELSQSNDEDRELLCELARLTVLLRDNYAEHKRKRAILDFSDLGQLALKLLDDPSISEEIRTRYRYVFADESQDLNALQDALVSRLSCADNLFTVGDLKQCIYRFRGAEPELFLARAYRKDDLALHEKLSVNYRTNRDILEFVNLVFDRLMLPGFTSIDYRQNERLTGEMTDHLEGEPPVECLALTLSDGEDAAACEAAAVCDKIRALVGTPLCLSREAMAQRIKEHKSTLVEYSDICVLVRGNNNVAQNTYKRLREEGIPVETSFQTSLGQFPGVRCLIEYLKLIDSPLQDIPLAAVLKSPLANFSDEELRVIRTSGKSEYFYQVFYAAADRNETPVEQKCRRLRDEIARYKELSGYKTVFELTTQIVKEKSYEAALAALPNGKREVLALTSFLFALDGKPYADTLHDFLSYANYFGDAYDLEETSSSGVNCVRVTTMHRSKGLEYPVVLLCGLSSPFHLAMEGAIFFDRSLGAGIAHYDLKLREKHDSVSLSAVRQISRDNQLREELNILYVAMTRPKYKLVLVGIAPENPHAPENDFEIASMKNSFSAIYAIAAEQKSQSVCVRMPSVSKGAPQTARTHLLSMHDESLARVAKEMLHAKYPYESSLKGKLKYTVTELNRAESDYNRANDRYIDAPKETNIGNLYHEVMEKIPLTLQSRAEIERAVSAILGDRAKDVAPAKIEKCLRALSPFIADEVLREQPFMLCIEKNGDKTLIQGKIDFLSHSKEGWVLVDYKWSGKNADALREQYRTQLSFYRMAVERILNAPVKSVFIYSLAKGELIEMPKNDCDV